MKWVIVDSFFPDKKEYFKIIEGCTIEDIKTQLVSFDRDASELCGADISKMPIFGKNKSNSKHVWVLIGIDHEDSNLLNVLDGKVDNDITAIIFADSEHEAKQRLFNHPILAYQIQDFLINDPDTSRQDLLERCDHDPVELIFGDTLPHLYQLCGTFIQVPDEYVSTFLNL
jgi:hypothetical protein